MTNIENKKVFFRSDDGESRKADQLLETLERIDDECDAKGIHFVKVKEPRAGEAYGINRLPKLVFFRNELPNIFEGKGKELFSTLFCF